jgi:hypothetical protein
MIVDFPSSRLLSFVTSRKIIASWTTGIRSRMTKAAECPPRTVGPRGISAARSTAEQLAGPKLCPEGLVEEGTALRAGRMAGERSCIASCAQACRAQPFSQCPEKNEKRHEKTLEKYSSRFESAANPTCRELCKQAWRPALHAASGGASCGASSAAKEAASRAHVSRRFYTLGAAKA